MGKNNIVSLVTEKTKNKIACKVFVLKSMILWFKVHAIIKIHLHMEDSIQQRVLSYKVRNKAWK